MCGPNTVTETVSSTDRLRLAERDGLRLAIRCRTLVAGVGLTWVVASSVLTWDVRAAFLSPAVVLALVVFTAIGLVHLRVMGTAFDRPWIKFAIYAIDALAICAFFAFVPVLRDEAVPQIIAFRAYGIYYLFPVVVLAALSLSWRLVVWTGGIAVVGYWAAFLFVVAGMDRAISWTEVPPGTDGAAYLTVFLSPDFIGRGSRFEETGFLLVSTLILALVVHRARMVFFAQIAAEAAREEARTARERIAATLGRYVPEAIAAVLIKDETALAPQERHAAVLVMDVTGFSRYAHDRPPAEVIATLNDFLGRSADAVSAEGGIVIQFTGDGLLAGFASPFAGPVPEVTALAAARRLLAIAPDFGFGVRIGLAAGPVVAGSIGSARRQAFTVYGDTVNRAARLETLGKRLAASVVLDAAVARHCPAEDGLIDHGPQDVPGFALPLPVWSLTVGSAQTSCRAGT